MIKLVVIVVYQHVINIPIKKHVVVLQTIAVFMTVHKYIHTFEYRIVLRFT